MNYRKSNGGFLQAMAICVLLPVFSATAGYLLALYLSFNRNDSAESRRPEIRLPIPKVNVSPASVNVRVDTAALKESMRMIQKKLGELVEVERMSNTTTLQFGYLSWEIGQLQHRTAQIEEQRSKMLEVPAQRRSLQQRNIIKSLDGAANAYEARLKSREELLLLLVKKLEGQYDKKPPAHANKKAGLSKPAREVLVGPRKDHDDKNSSAKSPGIGGKP